MIASTSCLTIVFTAIFSPILLKEKFVCLLDGVTIMLVATGSLISVMQQPENLPTYENANMTLVVRDRLTNVVTLGFYVFIVVLLFSRDLMQRSIK